MSDSFKALFEPFSKLDPETCWPYPANMRDFRANRHGYTLNTARFLWEILRGPLASDTSLKRIPRCSGKGCQNPFHRVIRTGAALENLKSFRGDRAQAKIDRVTNLTAAIFDVLENWSEIAPGMVPDRTNVINGVRHVYSNHMDTDDNEFLKAIINNAQLLERLP